MPDTDDRDPDQLAEDQPARVSLRDTDQDRTLLAMQQLEAALGAAAPRREQAWRNEVRRTLTVLGEATTQEADNAAQPDSLLSDIARTQPWLRNRVRGLRIHYRQLRDVIDALLSELSQADDQAVDFTDIRQRLAWVLAGLRHQRARESDLIYEAYYDAVRADIEDDTNRVLYQLRGCLRPRQPGASQSRHLSTWLIAASSCRSAAGCARSSIRAAAGPGSGSRPTRRPTGARLAWCPRA